LIENNYDAILVTDELRKASYASPAALRMLGYSWDEMKEFPLENFSHPEDSLGVGQLYDQVYKNPGMPVPWTFRARHRNGHYIWAEGVITNMLQNENVRGIVSNFRDVTERKEAEIQQAKMTRDLIQRNKDLEQFAYIVSHNLRGPVANILGIANILRYEELGTAEREEAQHRIFDATERLDEVIHDLNQILDLKQEAYDKKEGVDLQELVDGIMVSIENSIIRNNVRIVTDFTRVHCISTIRSYLQSIFYNLISNSIKYKRPDVDAVIKITSSEGSREDGVRLVFSDNGMGIDLASAGSKVFGLYKRFHPLHAEGKGMGLFMVKTQVETLGGEISIKSEVNKGTEFTIEL
jgi:PAS domain S-box-containing protein